MRLALALLAFLLVGCSDEPPSRPDGAPGATAQPERAEPQFRQDGTLAVLRGGDSLASFAIEIAENDSTRQRGMMERTSMPEDSGMLFIFPQEAPQAFWMANTPLSLDIIYADADTVVVSMAKYAVPYSSESLPSAAPAQFVLELEAGMADRYGIVEGDRFTWTRE
jgi:uncharacterized membrane protein (UPF0127 family)